MSVIAEVTVPVADFPLGRALTAAPEMRIELERVVPTGEGVMPFFWVWGDDVDSFVAALESNPAVDRVAVLDRLDDGALVEAVWSDDPGLIEGVIESRATLLEVVRREDWWVFRLRSPDHGAIAGLQRYCADNGVDLRLNWIHTLSEFDAGEQYGLTDDQRETLVAAFEAGYFDDPRGTSLAALGERFGISPRAVSKRLRRGLRNLVDAALADHDR
ncbi:helix-turn-helix domain-containing protein [Halorussus marinus]|uniref:helix-turn-helix domain-containing protein n=1 Tax=Halorussus marinus TaxID=2505976 RepID=UPI00106E2992|nr:helix-turn-helix domain-containing protein [Halorussus marinus]